MSTWGEIKTICQALNPSAVGGLVSITGSTSELAAFAHLVNMRIAGHPHKFRCLLRNGTLTLTGATSYDLAALIPDLQEPFQVHGETVPGREMGFRGLAEYNITVGGSVISLRGKTLLVRNPPASGTILQIPYVSNYLVLDNDGATRKSRFADDDDTSILYEDMIPMLVEGIMGYVARREKEDNGEPARLHDGRIASIDRFQAALEQATLNDRPIERSIFDYRFLTS